MSARLRCWWCCESRYFAYVLRHKWFVLLAGLRTGAPLWRLVIHDWSKFRRSEWLPYSRFFNGAACSLAQKLAFAENRPAFNRAWLLHQQRNDHHWQAWILVNDQPGAGGQTLALQMPDAAVREMVADWMGAGRAIRGTWEAASWYDRNKSHIRLHPATRTRVEYLLKVAA